MKVDISKNNLQNKLYGPLGGPIQGNKSHPTFKGPLDGLITQSLVTIDTNPMANAALVDLFAMVIPRTYVDTKKRNKYAGGETLFRELTGTVIVCLSSGYIAKGIAHAYNKFVQPEAKLNPNTWVSNDSLNLLKHSWDKSDNNVEKYVSNILSNSSGVDGNKTSNLKDVDWKNVQWFDDSKWQKFNWSDSRFQNIQENLKNESQISQTLAQIIEDKTINEKDAKQVLEIVEHRVTNALKVDNSINVKIGDKSLNSSLKNLLRDTYDLGKSIFTNKSLNIDTALEKLQKMNRVKIIGALAIASSLGLTNQYINRKITEKRTGSDAFVGEVDYNKVLHKEKQVNQNKQSDKKGRLLSLKLLASAGIVGLAAFVMKIKNPKDFIKKLEFTAPITGGNAIKTVYTATLVGRFLAAKNETELRESATRDYLGFLNWLVLGGFASKAAAQLLDNKQGSLFNIHKAGTGLKHWLNDTSLKSHAEIASKGTEFAKKNIWKLNVSHASGLLYSTLALGFLIPLLNIAVTKRQHKKNHSEPVNNFKQTEVPTVFKGFAHV